MTSRFRHVAALGSSFAAGPGIQPIENRAAARSAHNYPHLVAQRLGAGLTDLTVSGATTETVLDRPQRRMRREFPPQLDGVPSYADLVTITVGGNDLNYIGSMFALGIAGRLSESPWTRPLRAVLPTPQVPNPTAEDVERAAVGLSRVVEAVRHRAPDARILLVDYLAVIGPATRPSCAAPFDEAAIDALRRLGVTVSEVFENASSRSGAELVRMNELSREHALGSADPWVTGLPDRLRHLGRTTPFHPTAEGMRAVAEAVVVHLGT
ncbi:SGNH/GDSL hydrolase family protein [Streptomyces sp. VNUA24]|uniref:SGNH/GDSL hydrolase family protein n=1 Tax=Streptomyces sp. VNUA24 TaxID=3031131 RepID=UPI0023B85AD5|nr:SGNH/GDSL hydrolase family protein [Streptomyces sp. VNUA24]WEH13075.1 SGNH/GDSL hydrolase family protein [Streptomyces sp. VNUA24]